DIFLTEQRNVDIFRQTPHSVSKCARTCLQMYEVVSYRKMFVRAITPRYYTELVRSDIVSNYRPEQQSAKIGKKPIIGQGHALKDDEAKMIQQMIREESHTSRELFIPRE